MGNDKTTAKRPVIRAKRIMEMLRERECQPWDGKSERPEQYIPWDGKEPAEWEQEPDNRKK
jgi:hypothetical protein